MTTPIDGQQLIERAMELVTLGADGYNANASAQTAVLMAEFGVSRQRANTAIARAARRLRNNLPSGDFGPASFMLRVRLTERQRERLQLMADAETGGDMSELVRRRLFRDTRGGEPWPQKSP